MIRCLEKLVGDYSGTLTQSLETAATYLYLKAMDSGAKSRYHIGFLDLLMLLNKVLASTTNDLKLGYRSLIYRFLLHELDKIKSPSDLTIITFNYDLVMENVLEEIANRRADVFAFPRCYRLKKHASMIGIEGKPQFEATGKEFDGVGLLKLHGSMNWQSRHLSATPQPNTLFNPDRELHIMNSSKIFPSRKN